MVGRTFSFFSSNVGRKIGQTDHELKKEKHSSTTLGGKFDCAPGSVLIFCFFEKDIMLLKGHDRRTKKNQESNPWPPRRTAFGDPPPEFRQDLC